MRGLAVVMLVVAAALGCGRGREEKRVAGRRRRPGDAADAPADHEPDRRPAAAPDAAAADALGALAARYVGSARCGECHARS